jgi:hypothetical protein
MRVFIAVLVLIFSLQSWTKADDIRDFQIEGMSIGDSLLDHFSVDQIKKEINSDFTYRYPGNKFFTVGVGPGKDFFLIKKVDHYEDIGLVIKTNDKKYIIYGIQGRIFCENDINDCFSKQESISSDLKEFFGDNIKFFVWDNPHRADKTNQSHVYGNRFEFENSGEVISVNVYDWTKKISEEKDWQDHVSVSIHSKVFYDFLTGTIDY